ncbi:hypothetical protein ILUMI_10748 [Ignelater luminosus]|uniref:Endonuclease/exonuclease/phosphatase domain-containing protein n=1 Tax=Ignelater luminosus TaxID=2038154 RepID=A0A8K0GDV9_IGNLU|nr:hypothetical protein ILUMI_10748 [Ignelater luminosus]
MGRAYFRELKYSNQCELVFPLKITNDKSETIIEQEIRSVRQRTDNIHSLLEHTVNKIKKILEQTQNATIEINISLTQNGNDIPGNTPCATVISTYKDVVFTICKQTFKLIMNAPLVQSATLPVILYINYPVQPIRFKTLNAEKDLSEFSWYTSSDKLTWTKVGTTYKYTPTANDLDKFLKFQCIAKNCSAEGPVFEIISDMPIEEMGALPKCPFEKRHEHTQTRLSGKQIRVVSYNTLSNRYSETNSQFPYCSPQALSIDYRKQLILKELIGYNADIMCLQEVDHMLYLNYFKPKLAKSFKSIFHKKGNRISEGLACFYNSNRFKLLESKQLVFSAEIRSNVLFRQKWNLIRQSDVIKDCFVKQPTSLQVTILKSKELNEIIIVANTHLYYHSEANDIRLLQASIATDYLKHVFNRYKRSSKGMRISVIFCGDFNSVPTSAVFNFFSRGVVQHTFEIDEETLIRNICLNHPFRFGSACGTPDYTNYTGDFKGCLDYIFYDENSFKVAGCIPFLEETILSEKTALPNEVFPSDHIALVANLEFK